MFTVLPEPGGHDLARKRGPIRGDGAGKQKKLVADKRQMEKLDFSKSVLPEKNCKQWSSKEAQVVAETMQSRLDYLSNTLEAPTTGWENALEMAGNKLKEKGGNENTLNHTTSDLISICKRLALEVADEKGKCSSMTRDGMQAFENRILALHSEIIEFTIKGTDQIEGIQYMLVNLTQKGRSVYQKDFQTDKARLSMLKDGGHGPEYGKMIIATMNMFLSTDDVPSLLSSQLDGRLNLAVENIDKHEVMLWDADSAREIFPKYFKLLDTHRSYIKTRIDDMEVALRDSNSLLGAVAELELISIKTDVVDALGMLQFTDEPDAKPMGNCSGADSLRQGAVAVPLAGYGNLITPIDKTFLFLITKVSDIVALGGITLGSSYTKYLEGEFGEAFFETKVIKVLVHPGEALFLPHGSWPQPLYWEEPARGKDKKNRSQVLVISSSYQLRRMASSIRSSPQR